MNHNYYYFMLEDYRKKLDPNSDILTIRKAIAESIQNESFRVRQQYRHEMAKRRREEMENQKIMNRKIKELKEREKEITMRYKPRNSYGQLLGTKGKPKDKANTSKDSITVLLPVIKQKDSTVEAGVINNIQYESHSIPKDMLPHGKEDVSAYKVVKKNSELNRKYGSKQTNTNLDGGSGVDEDTLYKRDSKPFQDNTERKDCTNQAKKKLKERQMSYPQCEKRNYFVNSNSVYQNYHHGPSYDQILHYYRHGGGLYKDDLTVFGMARNANKYELLIVDDGPRTEEIRVKQRSVQNPRAFDILTIKENTRGVTPND